MNHEVMQAMLNTWVKDLSACIFME